MKKFLLATAALAALAAPAMAADMAAKAPVYTKAPPMVAAYSWTGCYIGGEGGYAWGHARETAASGTLTGTAINSGFSLGGGLAGGTIGCNYQMSNIVLGIEDDMSWTNKKGSAFDQAPFNPGFNGSIKESWIDTLRGRVGFTWDRALIYATGGGAFGRIGITACNVGSVVCVSDSATRSGWTVGGGVEWALWDSWTFKAEYLHVDFGTTTFLSPAPTGFISRNVPVTDDLFRVGLNYRFGFGGPVVARY
jgi:outer membrane immunogenic protein